MKNSDTTTKADTSEAGATEAAHEEPSWINHPKTVKRLQILVVIMGAVLIVGFAAVIARIVYLTTRTDPSAEVQTTDAPAVPGGLRGETSSPTPAPGEAAAAASSAKPAEPGAPVSGRIELPPGATIERMAMGESGLAIHFTEVGGRQGILIVDPETGRTRTRLEIGAPRN